MSPDEIIEIRQRKIEQERIDDIIARHASFCSAYESLQLCLKQCGDKLLDLSVPDYLITTAYGHGLWKLERTKLFKQIDDKWFISWCGRHKLYVSRPYYGYSKIYIRIG